MNTDNEVRTSVTHLYQLLESALEGPTDHRESLGQHEARIKHSFSEELHKLLGCLYSRRPADPMLDEFDEQR